MISIIIPVLNEAPSIEGMKAHWRQLTDEGAELIFVDGGSLDDSRESLQNAGFHVIPSKRGRASQMNTGALKASGDILIFLHADTRLPPGALPLVAEGLRSGHHLWGRFDVAVEGQSWLFPLIGFMISLRSRITGIATGDQALFMTREAFEKVGRFPVQPLMEDIEMCRRLGPMSRPLCLRARIRTSGRRWEKRGVCRTILLMWRLRLAYWLGASPENLAKDYRSTTSP